MKFFLIPFTVLLLGCFHIALRPLIGRGRVREGFCALWCMDAVFVICGTFLSFELFHYTLLPYFCLRNFLLLLGYLGLTALFLFLSPSGITLFTKKSTSSPEEMLLAEYRFHDTMGLIRNFLLVLLFFLPLLFAAWEGLALPAAHTPFTASDFYGGSCFIAFLLLVPICLRQALFWLRHLTVPDSEAAEKLQRIYSARQRYKKKNRLL